MDFTSLTDDQLVELVRAVVAECAARGTAVAAAAQAAMLSEAEKAQIAREASACEADRLRQAEAQRVARDAAGKVRRQVETQRGQAEQNKQNQQWGCQKTLAQMVVAVLGFGWTFKVWNKEGETRVYLDRCDVRRATGRVEYYHTGNAWHPPRTLRCVQGVSEKAEPFVQQIVEKACEDWSTMHMDCDQAARSAVVAIGEVPAELTAYGVARRSKSAA
jgi:hypothetical protein